MSQAPVSRPPMSQAMLRALKNNSSKPNSRQAGDRANYGASYRVTGRASWADVRKARVRPWRQMFRSIVGSSVVWLSVLFLAALPALAADDNTPDPANTPAGTIFRWLNFVLVFGGIGYLIGKFGAPYFRGHAREISKATREATEARATADRELREVDERVGALNLEIQRLRREAVRESAAGAERLRELARVESARIHAAARTEIAATERAGLHELRAIAARLATERAAELVRARVNSEEDAALFRSFVEELERTHR